MYRFVPHRYLSDADSVTLTPTHDSYDDFYTLHFATLNVAGHCKQTENSPWKTFLTRALLCMEGLGYLFCITYQREGNPTSSAAQIH